MKRIETLPIVAASIMAAASFSATPVLAADTANDRADAISRDQAQNEERPDAKELLNEATGVVDQMKGDPELAKLLDRAKGVYIVPDFGRGALVVGGRGGGGLVLAKQNGEWTNPAFFDFGAISFGPQAGVSAGSVAFLLMSDEAVNAFKNGNVFSLNAEAGLSIVDYSANAQDSIGKGDIVFWSDTEGAYAGATVSLTDVNWDEDDNGAFYDKSVDAARILNGEVSKSVGAPLKKALSG
ncbi:MAG: lipid-binding SYLF domain-containing protein [Methyloligella sp. ZOD6]